MSTANPNKLKIKDIITVVLLALINVVIFFASSFLYATPVTIILMPVFFALLEGIVYFIIGTKVKKPGAILINVGRGTTVDGEALAAAVHSGQLYGAGLDVTDPEPLPPEHPLWAEPNIIITPHVSGGFSLPRTLDNIVDIFVHNLRRYAAGQPLDNQMDRKTQYASGARLQSTL